MAKVFVLVKEWIAPDGTKAAQGDEIDLPRETDQQKADFERLLSDGIVTRSEVKANPADSEESEKTDPPQRTRRQRN